MKRDGTTADAVQGVVPGEVLVPMSIDEACAALAELGAAGRASVFVGGGTKLSLGAPPSRLDAVVRTTGLARIVEYAPSDQVITVEAGLTLGALQERLARDRQRLSLDAPWPERATIGGIVATNSFGPLRARSGAIRDLILGVSLVRADGVLARSGGKVVKNVAGFDLPKLVCGSLGTLALIAVVTLRVHPLPEASAARVVRGLDAAAVVALASALRSAQLEPSALVARRDGPARPWELALRFEGFGAAVEQQVTRLDALAPGHVGDQDGPASAFAEHQRTREDARLRLKLAALPDALPAVERALAALAALHEGAELAWYPTLGLGFFSTVAAAGAAAEGEDETAIATAIAQARDDLRALGGSLTVEDAPASLWGSLATWSAPSALALHRAVKSRFDPGGLLAPGRFVEGI